MTISGLRQVELAACVVVLGQGVALGQVQMKFPDMSSQSHSLPQLQVQPMQVRPIGQPVLQRTAVRDNARYLDSAGSHGSYVDARVGSSGSGFSAVLSLNSDVGLTTSSAGSALDHRTHALHEQLLHNGHDYPVHYSNSGWGYYSSGSRYGTRYRTRYGNRYGYGYPYENSYYGYVDGSYYAPQYSVQPQLPTPPPVPVEPPTDEDIAAYELRSGDAGDAVDLYRKILRDEPQDAESMRRLAVALIKDVRFEEGVAMMAMAYRTDALLADDALSVDLFQDKAALRAVLLKCVKHANRTKLGSAWLTVAVLMQTQDRDAMALKMLNKASNAGLNVEVVDTLKRALGG